MLLKDTGLGLFSISNSWYSLIIRIIGSKTIKNLILKSFWKVLSKKVEFILPALGPAVHRIA